MGLLIPEDIPLDRLPASERRVVRAFQSTLKDSWLIIPRLDLVNERRSFEVDVLLINDLQGIVAIEVKGGPLEVRKRSTKETTVNKYGSFLTSIYH